MSKSCVLVVFAAYISGAICVCPPKDLLSPCVCSDDSIKCGGNDKLDLLKIFDLLQSQTQRHFKEFYLSNNNIEELKAVTLGAFTFDSISIVGCANLTTIDRAAFIGTNQVTDMVKIADNPKLSSPDKSVFGALGMFKNASFIRLEENNINVIPSYSFAPAFGFQERLKRLIITGSKFETIEERAFWYLIGQNSLTSLQIYDTNISHLPKNTFEAEHSSDKPLDLFLYINKFMKTYNISENAFFQRNKRPINLYIDYNNDNKVAYLEEKVFLPFLMENKENTIVTKQILDCQDCRNFWLNEYSVIQGRIKDLKCTNFKDINDSSNFINCEV